MPAQCGECYREWGHAEDCRWVAGASGREVAVDASRDTEALLQALSEALGRLEQLQAVLRDAVLCDCPQHDHDALLSKRPGGWS